MERLAFRLRFWPYSWYLFAVLWPIALVITALRAHLEDWSSKLDPPTLGFVLSVSAAIFLLLSLAVALLEKLLRVVKVSEEGIRIGLVGRDLTGLTRSLRWEKMKAVRPRRYLWLREIHVAPYEGKFPIFIGTKNRPLPLKVPLYLTKAEEFKAAVERFAPPGNVLLETVSGWSPKMGFFERHRRRILRSSIRVVLASAGIFFLLSLILLGWAFLQKPHWEEFQRLANAHQLVRKFGPPPGSQDLEALGHAWNNDPCLEKLSKDKNLRELLFERMDTTTLEHYSEECTKIDLLAERLESGIEAAGVKGFVAEIPKRTTLMNPVPDYFVWRKIAYGVLALALKEEMSENYEASARYLGLVRRLADVISRNPRLLSSMYATIMENAANLLETRLIIGGKGRPWNITGHSLLQVRQVIPPARFFGGELSVFVMSLLEDRGFRYSVILDNILGKTPGRWIHSDNPWDPFIRLGLWDLPIFKVSDWLCAKRCLSLLGKVGDLQNNLEDSPGRADFSEINPYIVQFYPKYLKIMQSRIILQTAIALAHYREREGAFPNSLDSLVPDYIEEVPLLPFEERRMEYILGAQSIKLGWPVQNKKENPFKNIYLEVSLNIPDIAAMNE
jgi:hypothetical protein